MQLETDRLIIRSIQQGDEVVFSDMAQDGSLGQVGFDANCSAWIGDWLVEAKELTNNDNPRENYIPCTVILKENEEVIGSIGSTYYEDVDKVGIVYFLGTSFRQKGYITEAINAYVSFFFNHYREQEIIATILDANFPSWKAVEKAGFKLLEKKMYKDIDDEKEELYRFYVIRSREVK